MRKTVVLATSVILILATLTGCSNSEIKELNNISALNSESDVKNTNLSATDKEAAVYAQVSDRQLLDLTTLETVSSTDEQAVISYMESVDAQLCGTLSASNGKIDVSYTDYLLMEFEKTPYYWQRASMNIRGMDTNSRSIVVDVTYNTINYNKNIQSDSFIAKGEENYDQKVKVRFERWSAILSSKFGYSKSNYAAAYNEFVSVYGNPSDIISSQSTTSLTELTSSSGNQKTYTGLVNSDIEKSNAKMTVRYILVPEYTLGINQGYDCEHMYVVDYSLSSDPTEKLQVYSKEGSATISDNVYNTLFAYYQCNDESDYAGLCSLTNSFKSLDKYYSDLFSTTYRKHENFTISIFDVKGTTVTCGVTLSNKVRAKNSNMTFPIYTERYFYTLDLIDGSLKVTNEVLLSSELQGEPDISTDKVDTTGFTSSIDLDNEDKQSLEKLISQFGVVQLLQDTSSDNFSNIVDTSIVTSQLNDLKNSMNSVTGTKRVTWITSYLQGQSNYASIKCRELFQHSDNSIYEGVVTYDFINKGNKWYIYSYAVSSVSKLDTTDLTTKNSLCVVSKGGVDALNSQVVSISSDNSSITSLDSIGSVYKYRTYVPTEKTANQEVGLNTYTANKITSSDLSEYVKTIVSSSSGFKTSADDVNKSISSSNVDIQYIWKTLASAYKNYTLNYITSVQYSDIRNTCKSDYDTTLNTIKAELLSKKNNGTLSESQYNSQTEILSNQKGVFASFFNLLK